VINGKKNFLEQRKDYELKVDKMVWTCNTHGNDDKWYKISWLHKRMPQVFYRHVKIKKARKKVGKKGQK
jgi:hypothetical protein